MRRIESEDIASWAEFVTVDNFPKKMIPTAIYNRGLVTLTWNAKGSYLWCWLEPESLQIGEILIAFDLK